MHLEIHQNNISLIKFKLGHNPDIDPDAVQNVNHEP